ncbi:MAG TPA: OmpA family protein [Candidatus Angelobacter sp.]|nr:OmpA family protein [Candidatus Angelobacter sp.]
MTKLRALILFFAACVAAQQLQATQNPVLNVGNTPTPADLYCSGFITTQHVPAQRYVMAGYNSPDQTRYAGPVDAVYIHGKDLKEGERYEIIRHVKDPNHYEFYPGEQAAIRAAGEPYFEIGYVRIQEVQNQTGIAKPELSCADIVPGDIAIPFEERHAPPFRAVTLKRFAPPNGKLQGRIIMAADFDSFVGSKYKVYLNLGSDKGIKVGDYLRATRTYSHSYHDPEESLALKASAVEDTQADKYHISGAELASLPRRTLGDMVVLSVHKKSATAMILTALEDIRVGDTVELMDVSDAPEVKPLLPASAAPTAAAKPEAMDPPTISCTASPATIRVGETSGISCEATSPDGRPISIAFVSNGGKLSANRNQATLDTTDAGPGPIAVRATAFDDRQLSAVAVTTVNVEAPTPPAPTAQKLTELDFKPNSAYVDNRSKAILDDVALKMQQDPTSTVVLSGNTQDPEPSHLATQRADNAKTYLTKSKGIDGERIKTQIGGGMGRTVDITAVPAGATIPPATPAAQQQPKDDAQPQEQPQQAEPQPQDQAQPQQQSQPQDQAQPQDQTQKPPLD